LGVDVRRFDAVAGVSSHLRRWPAAPVFRSKAAGRPVLGRGHAVGRTERSQTSTRRRRDICQRTQKPPPPRRRPQTRTATRSGSTTAATNRIIRQLAIAGKHSPTFSTSVLFDSIPFQLPAPLHDTEQKRPPTKLDDCNSLYAASFRSLK